MIDHRLIKRLHTIYRACGIDEENKRAMLLDLTNGRTDSTKHLTLEEAQYLCGYLNGQNGKKLDEHTSDLRRHRSACLVRMQRMGMDTTDWDRVNAFCQDKRICGKPFYRLSMDELSQLIVKLEAILHKQQEAHE